MERIRIEVTERLVTSVTIHSRVLQAADGRVVAEGHPDAVSLVATPGSTFTLEQALVEGLVKRRGDTVIGVEVEPVPTPEEEE